MLRSIDFGVPAVIRECIASMSKTSDPTQRTVNELEIRNPLLLAQVPLLLAKLLANSNFLFLVSVLALLARRPQDRVVALVVAASFLPLPCGRFRNSGAEPNFALATCQNCTKICLARGLKP